MTDNEFKMLLISWSGFVKQYRTIFKNNSVMFPDTIILDYLTSHFVSQFKKNSNNGKKRPIYDLSDNKGNDKIEVKSSFDFGRCDFSKNQNSCQRIIYVCLKLNSALFFELKKTDVSIINANVIKKKGYGTDMKKYCNNLKPFDIVKF